jgi:hypothetical protein
MLFPLLSLSKNLCELVIDGMKPVQPPPEERVPGVRHPLIQAWKLISESHTLLANDIPEGDLGLLGFTPESLPADDRSWFAKLRSPYRTQCSTIESRMDYLLTQVRANSPEGLDNALSPALYHIMAAAQLDPKWLPEKLQNRIAQNNWMQVTVGPAAPAAAAAVSESDSGGSDFAPMSSDGLSDGNFSESSDDKLESLRQKLAISAAHVTVPGGSARRPLVVDSDSEEVGAAPPKIAVPPLAVSARPVAVPVKPVAVAPAKPVAVPAKPAVVAPKPAAPVKAPVIAKPVLVVAAEYEEEEEEDVKPQPPAAAHVVPKEEFDPKVPPPYLSDDPEEEDDADAHRHRSGKHRDRDDDAPRSHHRKSHHGDDDDDLHHSHHQRKHGGDDDTHSSHSHHKKKGHDDEDGGHSHSHHHEKHASSKKK